MAVTYSVTVKNSRLQVVIDAIGTTGDIKIGTAGMASILATVSLANPAGTKAAGVLTFTMPQTDASADATGIPAEATITDGTTDIITGLTVGLSNADIIVDSLSFTAGQAFTINSAAITHG